LFYSCFYYVFFETGNIFLFFCRFELIFFPLFFIILGWGYQPERFQSVIFLLVYIVFSGVVFLLLLSLLIIASSSFYVPILFYRANLFYRLMLFPFFVKLPVYLLHFWLPKAHVEAPVFGSILLAGILLKLGGYGVVVLIFFLGKRLEAVYLVVFLALLALFAVVLQRDFKAKVAYLSVFHMCVLCLGILLNIAGGVNARVLIILSHGVSSSFLFMCCNEVYYALFSRALFFGKGALRLRSLFCGIYVYVLCFRFGVPPLFRFYPELLVFILLVLFRGHYLCWIFLILVFSFFFIY